MRGRPHAHLSYPWLTVFSIFICLAGISLPSFQRDLKAERSMGKKSSKKYTQLPPPRHELQTFNYEFLGQNKLPMFLYNLNLFEYKAFNYGLSWISDSLLYNLFITRAISTHDWWVLNSLFLLQRPGFIFVMMWLIGNFLRVQIERILQELGQKGDTGKGRQH